MAETSSDHSASSNQEYVNLQDVLHSFNNSISEEQAWAVCYQCAQLLSVNLQERFRDIYYYGITAIQISTEGDVKLEINFNQGSGKGPPRKRSSFSLSKEYKSILTQTDAIQALGTAIYKALDYGLSENEEPHLSPDLETLIELMTDQPTDDDEGIDVERDCDDSQGKDQSILQDAIDLCVKHLSSHQNAQVHYKAVCRALATEAKQLVTFLDNIASGQEKLAKTKKEGTDGLDDLQRADWARLWVQIMRELRHGVMLKKVEHRQLPPLNYELTPFEMLLEDIRSRRYKLNEIMVNGNIPRKVKNDAHAVILDFIRSRPPLKPVNKRVLKSPPKREMDVREMLMAEIRKPQALKPVRKGKLVVGARHSILDSCDKDYDLSDEDDEHSPKPQRKVIKPVADFQVSTDDSDSYFSETDEDGRHHIAAPALSPLTPVDESKSWKHAVVRDMVSQPTDSKSLSRRHTISACDVKNGRKVPSSSKHVPDFIPEDDGENMSQNTFVRGHASRKPSKWVSYRKKHEHHQNELVRNIQPQSAFEQNEISHSHTSHRRHKLHDSFSKSHGNLVDRDMYRSSSRCLHDMSYGDVGRIARSKSTVCIAKAQRSGSSPERHPHRSVSPNLHARRAESPVRHLSRSETFTCSIPRQSRTCARNDVFISTRCDSPQTRQLTRSDSFPPPRSESPSGTQRPESPRRHSVQIVHNNNDKVDSACLSTSRSERSQKHPSHCKVHGHSAHDASSHSRVRVTRPVHRHTSSVVAHEHQVKHDRCKSPCLKQAMSDRSDSPSSHINRSRSQSPSQQSSHSSSSSISLETGIRPAHSNFQERGKVSVGRSDTDRITEHSRTVRQRPGIIRARSRQEISSADLVLRTEEEKNFEIIERTKAPLDMNQAESEHVFKKPSGTRVVKSMPVRSQTDNSRTSDSKVPNVSSENESNAINEVQKTDPEGQTRRLTRQTAIRTGRTDLRKVFNRSATVDTASDRMESRIRRVGVVSNESNIINERERDSSDKQTSVKKSEQTGLSSYKDTSGDITKEEKTSESKLTKPVRPVIRSRSEVRHRSEIKPLKGSHDLTAEMENGLTRNTDTEKRQPRVSFAVVTQNTDSLDLATIKGHDLDINDTDSDLGEADHTVPEVIKTSRSEFKVKDLLHVSWKSECPRQTTNHDSNTSCSDCRPLPHKWQNPIECLSLTLEEVTHIRMVLTKAELESLITDHDLYTQVSKGKICFTCKKTKFSLFGQWGTKCKFCQRTVCNYCLRKMSVPTEHFEKIPVYSLSPVPISPEVLEALKVYESTGSVPHSPVLNRKEVVNTPPKEEPATPTSDDSKTRRRSLQRSHTIGVGMGSRPPPNKALLKGPQMSICCDCKSMIMEIIRASRTSVSRITNNDSNSDIHRDSSASPDPGEVARRPRNLALDDKPRPRSMLATIASFNFSKASSDS